VIARNPQRRQGAKPSVGLEPTTPSLPLRFGDGKGGTARVTATKTRLQIGWIRRVVYVGLGRAWSLVVALVFPQCSLR
jgi:hypothetical protein